MSIYLTGGALVSKIVSFTRFRQPRQLARLPRPGSRSSVRGMMLLA
jgi:hypothetical protein